MTKSLLSLSIHLPFQVCGLPYKNNQKKKKIDKNFSNIDDLVNISNKLIKLCLKLINMTNKHKGHFAKTQKKVI